MLKLFEKYRCDQHTSEQRLGFLKNPNCLKIIRKCEGNLEKKEVYSILIIIWTTNNEQPYYKANPEENLNTARTHAPKAPWCLLFQTPISNFTKSLLPFEWHSPGAAR